jgi:hypothetical protein
MKKMVNRIAAWAVVMMTVFATGGNMLLSVHAENAPTTDTTITLNQYLVFKSDAAAPVGELKYTVQGTAADKTVGTTTVYAGAAGTGSTARVTGTPTITDSVFTADQTKYETKDTDYPAATLATGYSFVKSTFVVNFANVKFTEPGTYGFVVSTNGVVGNDDSYTNKAFTDSTTVVSKYLNVHVEANDTNDTLKITDWVLRDAETSDTKTSGFLNNYGTGDIFVKKTVSGNESRTNEYFTFNVQITNVPVGTVINISAVDTNKNKTTSLISTKANDTDKVATVTATMQLEADEAGNTFTLKGVPYGSKVYITEDAAQLKALGYTSTFDTTNSKGTC